MAMAMERRYSIATAKQQCDCDARLAEMFATLAIYGNYQRQLTIAIIKGELLNTWNVLLNQLSHHKMVCLNCNRAHAQK